MPHLLFRYADGGEEVYPLLEESIGIGREEDNPVVIDNTYISPHHARLDRDADGSYRLYDLSSAEGTYVNDARIREARLQNGDRIRFGQYEVGYCESPTDAAARPASDGEQQRADEKAWREEWERRQEHLEILEMRIAELEGTRQRLEEKLTPTINPVALKTGDSGGNLADEVARLEARHEAYREEISELEAVLARLKGEEVPAAEKEVQSLRDEREALLQERDAANRAIQTAAAQREEFAELEKAFHAAQARIGELDQEQASKQTQLDETRLALERARQEQATVEEAVRGARALEEAARSTRDALQVESSQFKEAAKRAVSQKETAEREMEQLRQEIGEAEGQRQRVAEEHAAQRAQLDRTSERLRLAEERAAGVIRDWSDYEKTQLVAIAEKKIDLENQTQTSEARLKRTREELQAAREQARLEEEAAKEALRELREDHYEPTRELQEELLLRNEELAREIERQQQQLNQLQASIRDGIDTERLVTNSLEERGIALETLEKRIGEEVNLIRAEVISLSRAPAADARPPKVPNLTPIFAPRDGPPPAPEPSGASNGAGRTSLIVFVPDHSVNAVDYRNRGDLRAGDEPLPLGFEGLAAATRGAVFSSLAMTVESGLPVLFAPTADLAQTVSVMKKLRAALPKRLLLLGWVKESFRAVSETLQEGSNFQELMGLLSSSSGSLTTDPYMNTFFESLNQGKRFLYLQPPLPWEPRSKTPFEERAGFVIDLQHFQMEDLRHHQAIRNLAGLVERTRQRVTVTESSRAAVRRFGELLGLGEDWVRVESPAHYRDWLTLLGRHQAQLALEPQSLSSVQVRDSLLAGTPLLGPPSEALNAFYPELTQYGSDGVLPESALVERLVLDKVSFERVTRDAEKRLVADHSYQVAARKLDEFVNRLSRPALV